MLYVFLVLAYDRRRILHFAVTAHPTAEWTAQQLQEAFPWDSAPRYLLRDRDRIFGRDFVEQVKAMGIKQVLSAPRSPWQRAYIERVIGTFRQECLDHVIVFNERCLYHHLQAFRGYCHRTRTHLALQKDSPEPRIVQRPETGPIISIPEVGGLHHRYERRAARRRGIGLGQDCKIVGLIPNQYALPPQLTAGCSIAQPAGSRLSRQGSALMPGPRRGQKTS